MHARHKKNMGEGWGHGASLRSSLINPRRVEMSRMHESMHVLKASLGLAGGGSAPLSENALATVELEALQQRASWLENEVNRTTKFACLEVFRGVPCSSCALFLRPI